jgi:hypothetical protein
MNTPTEPAPLEEWAKVELFGHTVLYAKVTKADVGDFLRLDIPNPQGICDQTRLINPKAIYGITFITRDLCLRMAAAMDMAPISAWQLPEAPKQAQLGYMDDERDEEAE